MLRAERRVHNGDGFRAWLAAASRGEFAIHGFRNRDPQANFFPRAAQPPEEARRRPANVSRKLRPLRRTG